LWQAFLFWLDDSLEGNFEVHVLGIDGEFIDFGFSYIARKGFFDFSEASSNFISGALGEHLDSTIRQVADKAGQPINVG
jgi:hypothetical protein